MQHKSKPSSPEYLRKRDGTREWRKDGQLHREDGPALIRPDGSREWRQHGTLHRDGGPAVEGPDGQKRWYAHGEPHREDGPAIDYPHGYREWLVRGRRHREDGPAVEYPSGNREWYRDGLLHREDGPAVEGANGEKQWWIAGKRLGDGEVIALLQTKLAETKAAAETQSALFREQLDAVRQQNAELAQEQRQLGALFNALAAEVAALKDDAPRVAHTKPALKFPRTPQNPAP